MSERRGRGVRVPAEIVAEARRLYEATTLSEAAIAKRTGMVRVTLRGYAAREGWARPDETTAREKVLAGLRVKIDREIADAEAALGGHGDDGRTAGAERMARTLASLVRTLRELARYDEERAAGANAEADEDDVTDLDAFRRDLAERLERLRGQHEG